MSKIIVIVGPTATGKTKASIELAKILDAEIINADSTALYKEPIIATAKVKESEMCGITHHMLDLITLNEQYSIYDYQINGRKILDELISKNRNIIIVGGSGLYIKALLYDYELSNEEKKGYDFSDKTNEELKNMADKIASNDIHVNNRKRLERFISYYNNTGMVLTEKQITNKRLYDFDVIGLDADREELYNYINKRCDVMFDEGLLDEARQIYSKNYKFFSNIIGFKELKLYFDGKLSLDEAKDLIKQNTRHYAKRQLTWFKNQMDNIKWFDVNYNNFDETLDKIKKYLNL